MAGVKVVTPPAYVLRFRDVLLSARVKRLSIDVCNPPVDGIHGILTTTHIRYAESDFQLLERAHEYLFWLPEGPLELYLNDRDHWRLFAYGKKGMLFSVNLTTMRGYDDVVVLEQKLRISTRSMTVAERDDAAEQLAAHLRLVGFDVSPERRLIVGTFDGKRGRFVDTNPRAFVRDFVVAAAIKGHFMANKGYALPGVRRVRVSHAVRKRSRSATKRAVPLGLRYQTLERDRGRCVLCGQSGAAGRLHVDHVIPWSQGGRTELENLQTLCERCNLGKGNRSTRKFYKERA